MARGRPELWENTVRRALDALGGEGNETAILRWVQDNRAGLRYGWQQRIRSALRDHGDGRGKAIFELVAEEPRRWRLAQCLDRPEPELPPTAERNQLKRLGRLMIKAMHEPDAGGLSALERYLLAVAAYKLGWYSHAVSMIDFAFAKGLASEHRHEAEQLRSICTMKAEIVEAH